MDLVSLLPAALAAFGGYRGYRDARKQGVTGIGALARGALGAYTGYQLGTTATAKPTGINPLPGESIGTESALSEIAKLDRQQKLQKLKQTLLMKGDTDEFSPFKISALAGGIPFLLGAFDQAPADVYQPTYNLAYGDFAKQRPGFTYIDPETGSEKQYAPVYIPEQDPANFGVARMGPYAVERTRVGGLKTGGLAEVKKFNEGGVNYLPSKVSHDENDSNNYVRATGYVEDGSGAGDKDEDTMLAQLADGEFVTRADGVLGAGIIAGANPNSFKDMREKGAAYFYEQQKRYKRVFDLLKEHDGNSKKN